MIKIIKHRKKIKRIKSLIPFIFIFIGIWIYNTINPEASSSILYIIISSVIFFIWFFGTMYSFFFMKSYEVLGNISFNNDFFLLITHKIYIKDIESAKIVCRSIYGQPTGRTFYVTQGDNNEICIKCKNGKIYNHFFLLEKKRELQYLKKIITYYKKKNINIQFRELKVANNR